MRELTVRLKFVSPCLGNVRKYHRHKGGRAHHYFVMPRHPVNNRVMFSPQWWTTTLQRAADILCHHQQAVPSILFLPEIDGQPRAIPESFYRRHITRKQYVKHEAFFEGDIIGITCAVPDSISDDDFAKLMHYAGKYCGISPAQHGKFGFYEVVTVKRVSMNSEPPELKREMV